MKTKKKSKTVRVSQKLTLSKYDGGQHHFKDNRYGTPSFAQSLSPIHFMIRDLYLKGAKLGSTVTVTMTVSKAKK